MRGRTILLAVYPLASLLSSAGCGIREIASGRPPADAQVIAPTKILDFDFLYGRNCSGCHGREGKGGLAIALNSPVYLALADDATIRRVTAGGVPGTAMPAFAQHSGGMLTDDQISVLIGGIRSRWANSDALRDADPPPYRTQSPGDVERGAGAYGFYCASCHGPDGRGGPAGAIVDDSYLGLVSNQNLRTTVIVGRPDMGAPDWRGNVPGKPMTPQDVSDVVAWLSAKRAQFPGQPYPDTSELRGESR